MDKIVANGIDLRNAIVQVVSSVNNAELMFSSVERKIHDALSAARTDSEKIRIKKELSDFQQKAKAAITQIRSNAQRTKTAFEQRLFLVMERRG